MRFRRRLQLNIMPILLFAVLLVTATVIYTSSLSIRTLQEDLMRYRLEVVYEYAVSEFETLERVNLQNTRLYLEEAKERVYAFVKETEIPGGFFLIFDADNNMIYGPEGRHFDLPEKTSTFLSRRAKDNVLIRYDDDKKAYLAMIDYVEKWGWYIIAVADQDVIYADVDKAVNFSLLACVTALAVAGYSLQVISKSISRPVEELTKVTMSMKDGEYSVRVPVKSEDEIGELAEAFNIMAEDIEENFTQIRAKSESLSLLASFAAGMAHDLKTPIGNSTTVISFMEAELKRLKAQYAENKLKKDTLESFLSEADDSIKLLSKNIAQASELVTGYKTVSVDQLNREKRWIDLREYVEEVMYTLRPRLKNTNIKVNNLSEANLSVWTYPGAISQIITNLVVNSLVHGFEDLESGEITIDFQKDEDSIKLVYTDNGVGISDENLKNIYNAFFTTKHDKGGSGLGMHIIYNLVKSLLHGDVECESTLGQGVKFTIVFPDESYIS